MLSFTSRRVLSHPGIFSMARRLPTRAISSNQSFAITVQRNFTTTASDRNSNSTADSKPESESKPKSTRRKTGSSPKTAGKGKEKKKKVAAEKPKKVVVNNKALPPKAPANAYALWLAHWISTEPKIETREEAQTVVKRGAQIWKTVPEYEKQQYREKAHSLLDEHRRRMEEWHEKVDPAILSEINRRRVTKGNRRIRPRPTRPINGYIRFFMHLRDEYPRTEDDYQTYFKALAARASIQWRAMSDAEKAEYNDPARADYAAWHEKRRDRAASRVKA